MLMLLQTPLQTLGVFVIQAIGELLHYPLPVLVQLAIVNALLALRLLSAVPARILTHLQIPRQI